MQLLSDLLGDIVLPFRVLLVAGFGVVFAILLLNENYAVVLGALAVAVVVALAADGTGQRLLPKHPRTALYFMEIWVLGPSAVAAVAAGAAVVVGARLAPSSGLDPEVVAVMEATATALTAFLTGAFVSWVGEKDSSRIADRIKRHFFAHYARAAAGSARLPRKHYFTAESRGERAVYSTDIDGVTGWGITARWKRASIVAAELASGKSDPPPEAPPAAEAPAPEAPAAEAPAAKAPAAEAPAAGR